MFCFPNSFGRRGGGERPDDVIVVNGGSGPLPSSPAATECPIASVESMTDDEPSSPAALDDRWVRRLSNSSVDSTPPSPRHRDSVGSEDFVAPRPPPTTARFQLLHEGDVQVCYLNHTRTVISKILSSKFMRRWETHRIYLNDGCISSKTPAGFLEHAVQYSSIVDVYVVARWDVGHKFCVRVVVSEGSLLIQANSATARDQWYHSILWKRNIFKYRNILRSSSRPEVILKELKSLVEYSSSTPLQDECVASSTLDAVTPLLVEDAAWTSRELAEEAIISLTPLLDRMTPSSDMCRFLSAHCVAHPRSHVVEQVLTPTVSRILKHNVDFGKSPQMRRFVQDYMQALYLHNDGEEVVKRFVASMHGPGSGCPHPRVLPNLVSVCLAAVCSNFEERRDAVNKEGEAEMAEIMLRCHVAVFLHISEYEDWRLGLAQFLHPIPFPDAALAHDAFIQPLGGAIERIAGDPRCDVHTTVLGVRDGKEGWFHVYSPSSLVCHDEGRLWCTMVSTLLGCCGRRKRFLMQLSKQLGTCLLLALRDHAAAQDALCLMLEWRLVEQEDQCMQLVTTLQSTAAGRARYQALCAKQKHLEELQQKGGPRKLTLPSRSTDADIARLLSLGSFGNLECLSLAFTHVTSACAEQLIKLPALRYLNLWATQFGDAGLLLISEHLSKLQVLNLCETPVSDKGIASLAAMTSLCKLNLNSTKLTAATFEILKKKLPGLQEFDVRYTEAW